MTTTKSTTGSGSKLTLSRIREIVKEEVQKADEYLDHDGVKTVINTTANLLKALAAFEDKATAAQTSAVGEPIAALKKHLVTMVDGPKAYTDSPKKMAKKVVFRKGDSSENIV